MLLCACFKKQKNWAFGTQKRLILLKIPTTGKDLNEAERYGAIQQASLFLSGEEAVTLDLLPLLKVASEAGYLEDEIYLTSFLWEEAKHVDFFSRLIRDVWQVEGDLHMFHTDNYKSIFYQALPEAMHRLYTDDSPEAQVEASVTYNLVVEGVLAETGYEVWYQAFSNRSIMPGMVEGIQLIQRDESRHIGFAVYFLSRLIAEYGEHLWITLQQKMAELMVPALGLIQDIFSHMIEKHGYMPFDLQLDSFMEYAMAQSQKRLSRIEKALNTPLDVILFPK